MSNGTGEVRIEGLDTLVRTLKKAGEDIAELKDADTRVADIVVAEAAARAPRQSGKLAGSIRSAKQAKRARVQVGRASVPYAGPIHWGWPARNIGPQPFIADAAVATESRWTAQYMADVEAALDKVKGA